MQGITVCVRPFEIERIIIICFKMRNLRPRNWLSIHKKWFVNSAFLFDHGMHLLVYLTELILSPASILRFFFFFLYPVIFLILLLFVLTFPTSYLVISEQNHPTLSVPLFMPIMSKTSDGNIFISRKSMLFCKEIRNNIKLVISIFKALTKAQNPHKFSIKTDFLEEII